MKCEVCSESSTLRSCVLLGSSRQMADRRDFGQALVCRLGGLGLALMLVACARPAAIRTMPKDSVRLRALEAEVLRLSVKVNELESLQQKARRSTLAARDRQSPLGTSETAPAMLETNAADAVNAERELRFVYKALMRAIERLEISTEEKEALKSHLRPIRTLDHENPWSVAEY
jgi:hypothetical protein